MCLGSGIDLSINAHVHIEIIEDMLLAMCRCTEMQCIEVAIPNTPAIVKPYVCRFSRQYAWITPQQPLLLRHGICHVLAEHGNALRKPSSMYTAHKTDNNNHCDAASLQLNMSA